MSKNKPEPARERPWRRRVQFVVLSFLLLGSAAGMARKEFIQVLDTRNGSFSLTPYPLLEEKWDHPRLALLRRREGLDRVVAGGGTQFEKIVLLRKWVHDQWVEGTRFHYPPFDAVEILDLARARGNRPFCAQYAVVFLQACRSLGLHARYVDTGHFLTGIWSDDFNGWVIMNPADDCHYERGGKPLGAIDLSQAYWSGSARGIEKVLSDGTRSPLSPEGLKVFSRMSIIVRSNHLADPGSVIVNGTMTRLVHKDDFRDYPRIPEDNVGYADSFLAWHTAGAEDYWPKDRKLTDDPDDFREPFNQTFLVVAGKRAERGVVKIKMIAENCPDFKAFVIRFDGGGPQETASSEIVWTLPPGPHRFSARVKTLNGWLGPESWIDIHYKPNWFKAR